MAKIQYEKIALRTKAVATIAKANVIIEEFEAQGFKLTLRQLYYQFVARGWLRNHDREYQNLSKVITSARRAGLVDWDAIIDRTRFLRTWGDTFETAQDSINAAARDFKVDLWADQSSYIEVWFEKDALLGVFERAGANRRIPLMSCRGYGSDSTWWESAQRINDRCDQLGKKCIILHFGDHDPSGVDMTRDITARLNLFNCFPKIKRMALNMAQVNQYNPPPNPAKKTDSRYRGYKAEYGKQSWELDALAPDVMVNLVLREVNRHIDEKAWDAAVKCEATAQQQMSWVAKRWSKLVKRWKPTT